MFFNSPIHRFTNSPNTGVTLVELLIVIAIIGIIVLFATIDTGWFQKDARVTEARDRLLADVEDAKLKSLAKVPHGIIIATTSYRMVCLKEGSCSVTTATACCQDSDCPSGESCTFPLTVNFRKDSGQDCPDDCSNIANSTVTLSTNVKVSLSTGTELWYDRKGMPRTDSWTTLNGTLRVWYDDNGDSAYTSGEPTKAISIGNGGRILYE